MSALAEAVAADLAPLGALAERAVAYVLEGVGDDVLAEVRGRGKELKLRLNDSWGRPRSVLARFGDGDEAALERLGRLYAAAAARGVIDALSGELRWVECLVWEGGHSGPNTSSGGDGTLRLELVARRMPDPAPLLRASLEHSTDFTHLAFANNAVGAPDAGAFFAAHSEVVEAILREAHPTSIERLDDAKTPVAPFAAVLADLASDARVTLRRPALKMLARDPEAARAALRAVAADDDRRPKERELAERALEMFAAPPAEAPAPAALRVPPMSEAAKQKLRALCDEWLAQAEPKFQAHAAQYGRATASWIEPVDAATLARVVADAEAPEPWREPAETTLVRLQNPYVVALAHDRLWAALGDPDFAPVHVARILARILHATASWFASSLLQILALRRANGAPCSFADAAAALRYAAADPSQIDRCILEGSGWGVELDAAYLAEHQQTLEIALGARAAPWLDPLSHAASRFRKTALDRVQAMPPAAVGERVREALFELALRGGKAERPAAQACLLHLGGWEARAAAALGDKTAEVRANAASLIARAKLPLLRDELRRALAKEKNSVAHAGIMEALEASGEPQDALTDRDALRASAQKLLAKAKCPVLEWPEVKSLPPLRWADTNEAVDDAIVRGWIAETHKTKSPAPSPVLRLHARSLRRDERAAFALALLDAWIAHDTAHDAEWSSSAGYMSASTAVADKGILALVGAFGAEGVADRVASFLKTYYGVRAAQSKALLQMLAHVDDRAAIQLLLATATRFRTPGIRAEAEAQTKALAERRGWTVDEMADRTIPAGGLDDDGTLSLSYGQGGRSFVLRLDPSLRVTLHGSDGAALKSLPAPHKDEDEAAAKAAKAAYARAKKEIEGVLKMQRARLYEAMCTQRTWRFDDWSALLAAHPIMRHVVCGVVWVGGAEGSTEEASFRPLGDGSLSTADGREVKLTADAIVRVAHPLTTRDARATDWATHLGDFEVLPLFPQFGRVPRAVADGDRKAKECKDFVGHMLEAFKLRGGATALGYVRGPAEDGGWFYRYEKIFPSLGLRAVLSFSGNGLPEENRTVALGAFAFERTDSRASVALGDAPPVLFSEVYNDAADLARAGTGFDAAWESKVG